MTGSREEKMVTPGTHAVTVEALHLAEENFRLLVESVRDYAIFMLDPVGHVLTWNAGAERAKGYTADEIIGRHFSTFYTREDVRAGKCERILTEALRRGSVEDEGWRVRKDGSRFWALVVITALYDKTGQHVGFAKVTRDMSERRVYEEALRHAKEGLEERVRERTAELVETNRELEEFAYVASHDLQEPIRKILIYGERMQEELGACTPRQQEFLRRMVDAGQRLRTIVQNLLQFSRLTRAPAGRSVFGLNEAVAEALEDLEVPIAESRARIEVTELPSVNGNRDQLRHVFQNLISNALKFRTPGAVPRVTIRSAMAPAGRVAVAVSDNGIGFDETYKDKIFLPFQRLHTRENYEGTGIGLAIVKKIVVRHGGTIDATSAEGQGSVFTLEFPAAPRA